MENHIRECPGLSPDMRFEKPTFFRILDRGNLCKNCWCLFSEDDWKRHRKTQVCRKGTSTYYQKDLSQNIIAKSLGEQIPLHSLQA